MSGRARFAFWWEGAGDNGEPLAFFNVVENDLGFNNGSTVDGETLLKTYGIPLPLFPDFRTWRRQIDEKRRCFRCWATVRGGADLARHRAIVHKETGVAA